jgi:DNA mismatch repair protein MutS2
MTPQVFRALEFDQIREALAGHASTPLGHARALALEPSSEPGVVAEQLALTSEAVAFISRNGQLTLDAPDDLADTLDALAVPDEPLLPLRLLGLARFVESLLHITSSLRAADRERPDVGRLAAVVVGVQPFDDEVRAIRRAIEPGGEISDHASPALREIRDQLRRQRTKLRSTLEGLTRGSSPTATGATSSSYAPSTATRSPVSSMARRRAAPVCTSSRCRRSSSTTTWSRWLNARRKRSTAF